MSSWLLQNKQLICEIRKETKSTKTKQENINKSALKKGQTRQKPKNQKPKNKRNVNPNFASTKRRPQKIIWQRFYSPLTAFVHTKYIYLNQYTYIYVYT